MTISAEEQHILDLLSEAHNAFVALGEHHPSDLDEWVPHLHALQEKVMVRPVVRANPHFTQMRPMEYR